MYFGAMRMNCISCKEDPLISTEFSAYSLTDLIPRPPVAVLVSQFVRLDDSLSSSQD